MPLMLRRRSYKQTLFDDFDGAVNSAPNATYWNNLEDDNDYPAQAAKLLARNAYLDGNSNLVIRTVRESDVSGASYTSGQISTVGKFEQAGGRFEFRAQMPAGGSGIWPAGWQLGANWPVGGEIDTFELFNDMTDAQGYYHYDSGGHQSVGGSNQTGLSAGFHTYATEWDPGAEIRWYIDGVLKRTHTNANVVSNPMWLMLDIYIGGPAGDPTGTTFPQSMLVDWVRVSQLS